MELPATYEFVYKADMQPEEVLAVRRSTGWGEGDSEVAWLQNLPSCLEAVGVRDEKALLVGVGFIVGNTRHAVLCDLNVRPEHQGRGIGSAIVKRRVQIIDELGIPYVHTSLAPTNPLVDLYASFGFKTDGSAYLRTTPAK